ncbi:hypothetical protein IP91_03035 [Pseudoduganella lurida]|uniref:CAAX prenyl protease 2/Lysostaphin resistance protein A-like domain-containing protein n=1 Tax=Pseudoduganella lurida TaxID=1036180 RepID=A0A562R5D1_9BURK|nr:CPBP family intramembrane glutamic endopeptidase [Pseudoduganella lurida]TWI64267.1 hypothetical protein IP91_03035 [Pseudoduganella lurida]
MSATFATPSPDTAIATPPLRKRLLAHPLVRFVLAVLSVLVTMVLAGALSEQVPKAYRVGWPMLLMAVSVIGGYSAYVRWVEKRPLAELGRNGMGRELGRGLGLGALLVVVCSVVLLGAGVYTITGTSHWTALVKPLPEQVFVAFLEEILFRAIVFRLLEKSWGTAVALVVSTLLFALAHMPNESFTMLGALATAVAGAALSGAYLVTRRLWLPVGMHFAWNFLFDAVFAVPVSGHAARGWIQVTSSGPAWLSGGAYGIEASVVTVLAWGIATVLLLTLTRRRGQWRARP